MTNIYAAGVIINRRTRVHRVLLTFFLTEENDHFRCGSTLDISVNF